jgi:hypothetical protein
VTEVGVGAMSAASRVPAGIVPNQPKSADFTLTFRNIRPRCLDPSRG